MKLNKRLFGPVFADAADLLQAGQQHHRQGANSRRVKDMVSQPKQKTGAGSQSVCVVGI